MTLTASFNEREVKTPLNKSFNGFRIRHGCGRRPCEAKSEAELSSEEISLFSRPICWRYVESSTWVWRKARESSEISRPDLYMPCYTFTLSQLNTKSDQIIWVCWAPDKSHRTAARLKKSRYMMLSEYYTQKKIWWWLESPCRYTLQNHDTNMHSLHASKVIQCWLRIVNINWSPLILVKVFLKKK